MWTLKATQMFFEIYGFEFPVSGDLIALGKHWDAEPNN